MWERHKTWRKHRMWGEHRIKEREWREHVETVNVHPEDRVRHIIPYVHCIHRPLLPKWTGSGTNNQWTNNHNHNHNDPKTPEQQFIPTIYRIHNPDIHECTKHPPTPESEEPSPLPLHDPLQTQGISTNI